VLGQFGEKLSRRAEAKLNEIGVEVQLGAKVVGIDATGIDVEDGGGARRRIPSRTKVWAAGVSAAPIGKQIAEQAGVQVDRAGRVPVNPDLTLPGHPEVFVVGDMMALDGLPGVAQVAMQGAEHAAGQITKRLAGKQTGQAFHYFDKGSMATVSRFNAVAAVGPLRLSGFLAWLMWLVIHIVYLIGFKNRVTTLLHWAVSFVGRGRSERTVTLQQVVARNVLKREGTYALGMPRAQLGSATESSDAPESIGDGERLPA
jgi:NADH dehydrogenase